MNNVLIRNHFHYTKVSDDSALKNHFKNTRSIPEKPDWKAVRDYVPGSSEADCIS